MHMWGAFTCRYAITTMLYRLSQENLGCKQCSITYPASTVLPTEPAKPLPAAFMNSHNPECTTTHCARWEPGWGHIHSQATGNKLTCGLLQRPQSPAAAAASPSSPAPPPACSSPYAAAPPCSPVCLSLCQSRLCGCQKWRSPCSLLRVQMPQGLPESLCELVCVPHPGLQWILKQWCCFPKRATGCGMAP